MRRQKKGSAAQLKRKRGDDDPFITKLRDLNRRGRLTSEMKKNILEYVALQLNENV